MIKYDAENTREYYNKVAEREWERLTKNRMGELIYAVHLDLLKKYIRESDHVLELGAGGGRYTKDLAKFSYAVTTSDLSPVQLKVTQNKMQALGLNDAIKAYKILDMSHMPEVPDASYEVVVCIGGALNYLFSEEKNGIKEMLRVLKPGGKLILGVISKIGSLMYYMDGVAYEKELFGIEATRWLFATGTQDAEHYPVPSKHYLHMMTSRDLDKLFEEEDVRIIEKSGAGLFSHAKEDVLNSMKYDHELWEQLVKSEIEFTKNPATIDCGMNIIYVVEKL